MKVQLTGMEFPRKSWNILVRGDDCITLGIYKSVMSNIFQMVILCGLNYTSVSLVVLCFVLFFFVLRFVYACVCFHVTVHI